MSANKAFQPDSDVLVTFEDQSRINQFARHNAKAEDLKDELKNKTTDLQNLEDAFNELELNDEDDQIDYLVGEVFISQNLECTLKSLTEAKEKLLEDIKLLKLRLEEIAGSMSELKTLLYAKFGNQINLDEE